MMKRRLLITIMMLIIVFFAAGCGGAGDEPGNTGQADGLPEIVLENEAFKIYEPAPDAEVRDEIIVKGLARVWEATVQYEFEDGHFILDQGFATASEGAPGWGDFEITIDLKEAVSGPAKVVLYEESAKDGSRLHELMIPVIVAD